MREKYKKLTGILSGCGRLAVAFSSGVDSAFLLFAAREALGENVTAFTASAPVFPERERRESAEFCERYGIKRIEVFPELLSLGAFKNNPPDRCYHCKKLLMGAIKKAAAAEGFSLVAEGSNADDAGDWRPGMRAVRELGVISPLLEAGLTKDEIRELSRGFSLPTRDKPSFACLASRFAYGDPITEERLSAVESAEELLFSLGLKQLRVRVHGDAARIETEKKDMKKILDNKDLISERLHALGFKFVSLDLDGFRSGSMNRVFRQ